MTSAQMNGEFWWLNEKVAALTGAHAPPVAFGDMNDLGTDESDMVIFRDEEATENNEVIKNPAKEIKHKKKFDNDFIIQNPIHTSIVFFPETEITTKKNYETMIQPSKNDELIFKDTVYYNNPIKDIKITNSHGSNYTDIDEMELIFPITENITSGHKSKNDSTTSEHSITGDPHAISDTNPKKQEVFKTNAENICTALTIDQCKQKNGTVYHKHVTR
ncbi:hypothetical protein EVAR_12803_1 [Eumeta japonica]|uniref:Uncharacterized protein n=1 Tax=Eumeta variegata TaxID=151549 RepID=A0A4C1UC50_EUMVA|nr:hypothetical protein EVAR_12803_1 [Eumeta japonica]